jgi:hypothetical protein
MMMLFGVMVGAALRIHRNSTLAIPFDECAALTLGAQNWPAFGTCCSQSGDAACSPFSVGCPICRLSSSLCADVIEPLKE